MIPKVNDLCNLLEKKFSLWIEISNDKCLMTSAFYFSFEFILFISFFFVPQQVEQYAPGLPQKISDASISTWKVICSTCSAVYTHSSEFLKTKVFV